MSQKKVLVVDDEAAFLLSIGKILQGPAFLVDTAGSLDEALDLCRKKYFDVVITDMRLSDVMHQEGLDILRHVREEHAGTKVLVLTGYGSKKLRDDAYALGAYLYLEKPVSVQTLRLILETLDCTEAAAQLSTTVLQGRAGNREDA